MVVSSPACGLEEVVASLLGAVVGVGFGDVVESGRPIIPMPVVVVAAGWASGLVEADVDGFRIPPTASPRSSSRPRLEEVEV